MTKKVIYAFLSCFALLLTGGCREQDCVEEIDTSHARNSLYLNLSLRVNDGSGAVSRATDEGTILGTDEENKIHSLYIYLFNSTNNTSTNNTLVYWADITNFYQADDKKTDVIKLQDINLPEQVSIYLAANLTRQQAESITSPEATYKTYATSYTRAINEFAPYEFMPQFGVTGISKRDKGIAMTGQAVLKTNETQKDFDIYQYTSPDTPLPLKVDLERVVAKALLTVAVATTDNIAEGADKNEDYALIDSGNKNKGWVRISDIYYFPNGTNKSLYWFKQTDNNEDPNSDLAYYITSTEADTELALNTAKYQNDFVYYNQTDQYKLYYAYYQAKKFDESQNEANTYTDGMYFLENTFSTSDLTDGHRNQLQTYKLALPMVTSISIALRYTPKEIYVEKGLYDKLESGTGMSANEKKQWADMKDAYVDWKSFEEETISTDEVKNIIFETEADAQFVLTMSLKLNKAYISSTEYGNQVTNGTYSGSKFPDNTFFAFTPETDTDDKFLYHYYTYGARQEIANPIYYVPYVGGWAYYYTYLDGDSTDFGEGTNSSKAEYSDSQVKRNTYYILKLNKITRLGGSKTDPNNIQVNTTVVPWTKGGRLDVDLW
ncbi:uncharacterized protein BN750_00403 [Bacteroides sp. CAG:661]|nr:uncharacterized protein BN750_00403 [Bacteroides sp. CAG:661]